MPSPLSSWNTVPSASHRFPRQRFALGIVLACTLCLLGIPGTAVAEQRMTDTVLGKTAQAWGIASTELPDIGAPRAIVMGSDGTVYFERDADTPVKIASITKVMTAIVALEHAQLTDTVTVDHTAATVGQSSAGLKEGDTLTMEAALRGLLIPSGNDAALAIATTVGRALNPEADDPVTTFVNAINAKARELGCKDTLFENPHGLDFDAWAGDMHSTARDVALMYAHAMKNDTFRAIVNSPATALTVTGADGTQRQVDQDMHNELLGQEGNIGGKTGTTDDAGYCFVGGYSQDKGGEVYTVVLGADSNEQRFADTAALGSWYYAHVADVPIANTVASQGGKPVIGQAVMTDWTDRTVAATLQDPAQTAQVFSLAGPLEQTVALDEITGDVQVGQKIGELSYAQDGKKVVSAELVAAQNGKAPNPLEWVLVHFDRLIRFFEGRPGTAEEQVVNTPPDPLAYDAFGAAA